MNHFVKNIEDILKYRNKPVTFYDAETLTVYWETEPGLIARILPPPLKPARQPLVHAFVANYPRTSFGPSYREAALFVLADYQGEPGTYCLSMPITDDMAMGLGREIYGFPKKMAGITLQNDGDSVEGAVGRHGIDFFHVKAILNGKFNAQDGPKMILDNYGSGLPVFNIKYSKAADGSGFDLKPLLIKQGTTMDIRIRQTGEAVINLEDSPHDPWAELKVIRTIGCVYTVGETILLPGTKLAEVDPGTFLPYSYLRWDWWTDTV